jgi:N6-L-threonylcarbamoyladenine synthase
MKILAIDTSCDETSVAVTEGTKILSNIVWSQISQQAKFGGVMPSLAQRLHEERINWVVEQAITKSQVPRNKIEAIAVTEGPGLAIALGVGIKKAKELAIELKVPLIGVNHIEGHLLSALAELNSKLQNPRSKTRMRWPALGLVVSGGHTELVQIKEIGNYEILASTTDDALGEALDKAARMLGLGYPGGAILEKMALNGDIKAYPLPMPMAQSEIKNTLSYSGLKTAMYRLVEKQNIDSKKQIYDLAACFQNRAFQHLERVIRYTIQNSPTTQIYDLLVGGGVAANMELRKRLRKMGRELGLNIRFPYSTKLCGDNAAMIGIAAGYKLQDPNYKFQTIEEIDRKPRWKVNEV